MQDMSKKPFFQAGTKKKTIHINMASNERLAKESKIPQPTRAAVSLGENPALIAMAPAVTMGSRNLPRYGTSSTRTASFARIAQKKKSKRKLPPWNR